MATNVDLARVIIKILCRNECVSTVGDLSKCLKDGGYPIPGGANNLLQLVESFPRTFSIYPGQKTKGKIISIYTPVPLCHDHCKSGNQCQGGQNCGLHICKYFLLSDCSRKNCSFGHIIQTDHNYNILSQFLLDRLDDLEIKSILRHVKNRTNLTKPVFCSLYNGAKGCSESNCPFLHVCKHFLENTCKFEKTCKRSHDITSPEVSNILRRFGVDVDRGEDLVLQDLRTMFESQDSPLTRYNSMSSLTSSNEQKHPVKNRSRSARRQKSGRDRSLSPKNPFTDGLLPNQNMNQTPYPQPQDFGGARPKIRGQCPDISRVHDFDRGQGQFQNCPPPQGQGQFPRRPPFQGQDQFQGRPPFQGQDQFQGCPPFQGQDQFPSRPTFQGQDQFQGRPPFQGQDQFQGRAPFQGQDQFQGRPPFQGQDQFHGRPPFQGQDQFQGRPPFQGQDQFQGRPRFQGQGQFQNRPPVHDQGPFQNCPPLPGPGPFPNRPPLHNQGHFQNRQPLPGPGPFQNRPPFQGQSQTGQERRSRLLYPNKGKDNSSGQGQERQKSNLSFGEKQVSKDKEKPDICIFNLRGTCSFKDNCFNVHKNMIYQWQYYSKDWTDFDSKTNEEIEMEYCQPKKEECSAKCRDGKEGKISFTEPMEITTGSDETNMAVRRLSTISSVDAPPGKFKWTTEWQWYWKNLDGAWVRYGEKDALGAKSDMDSDMIEEKYLKDPKSSTTFQTSRFKYELNFVSMTQKNLKSENMRRVARRPLFFKKEELDKRQSTSLDSVESVPKEWSVHKFRTSKNLIDHYEKVQLEETSEEYKQIADLFSKTMPRDKLRKITRVESGEMWNNFSLKRKQMMTKAAGKQVKELSLFHGTVADFIEPICHQGFDFRFSGTRVGAKLGKGSYFARDAKYSSDYTTPNERGHAKMFVARVLVGEFEVGKSSLVRPPQKNGFELYDSCVNHKSDPSIYVVFTLEQAYPEYLITYKTTRAM